MSSCGVGLRQAAALQHERQLDVAYDQLSAWTGDHQNPSTRRLLGLVGKQDRRIGVEALCGLILRDDPLQIVRSTGGLCDPQGFMDNHTHFSPDLMAYST